MLDTIYTIETPEGVELHLKLAGPMIRARAWAIDFFIRALIYIPLGYTFYFLDYFGVGLLFLMIFILEWIYPIFFEIYFAGATPGKIFSKIKVIQDSGAPVDWTAAFIRNLLRAVDFLPFFYGFGLLTTLCAPHFKRLGDLAAGTLVVYNETSWQPLTIPEASPHPLPYLLNLEEQLAIVNFAARSQTLSAERQEELAQLLNDMIDYQEETATQKLLHLANGLYRAQ